MELVFADCESQYKKDKKLRESDVQALIEWVNKQPHLPTINDLQAILFLHSCYYSNEAAKTTIENFFTFRTLCPEFTANQNIIKFKELKQIADGTMDAVLPKQTPEGYTIIYMQLIDTNPDVYHFANAIKVFDMASMLHLHRQGPSEGFVFVADCKGTVFGHMAKIGLFTAKKLMYYLQEAMPVRLKAIHVFNVVPVIDKIFAMVKPFMKAELVEMIHLYKNVDEMCKFVPRECLPADVGGSQEPVAVLHEKLKDEMQKNIPFFEWLETLKVDETRRPGKPKSAGDVFGVEGTFKKLEVD